MKKKLCLIIAVLMLVLCLVSCGNKNTDNVLVGRWESDQYGDVYKFEEEQITLEKYDFVLSYTVVSETENEDGSKTYKLEIHDEEYPDEVESMDAVVDGEKMTFGNETLKYIGKVK